MSTGRSHLQRGLTFVEVTVALSILALLALAVERTLTTATNSERYLTAIRRATERGQQVCYEVFRTVSASRKLFQDDVIGQGYLNALDLSRLPLASDSRLPLIDDRGELGPDAIGSPMTGNVLLFVEESDALPCVSDGAMGKIRYIDTYRFVCVYRNETDTSLVAGAADAHDLVVWRSVAYPNRAQLLAIEDADELRDVVVDLHDRYDHDTAWDPGAPIGAAFYPLTALGILSSTALTVPNVEEEVDLSTFGRLVLARVQLAATDPDSPTRKGVFSADDPLIWAPDGFEIKIAGASGSRRVWIHLVVESPAGAGRLAVHPSTMIASARDL